MQVEDLYFWIDSEAKLSASGSKVATLEFGEKPLPACKEQQVVLLLPPGMAITDFRTLGLWSPSKSVSYGYIRLPDHTNPPRAQFLPSGLKATLKGLRYNAGSGPMLVMDRRTVKIYGLRFDGNKAPDTYFFVGKGDEPRRGAGVKVPVRGKDTADSITSLSEAYTGDKDVVIELPADHDIYNIDWISLYCYRFAVNFAHVTVHNLSSHIPPYIPPKTDTNAFDAKQVEPWPVVTLLGRGRNTNFTFQLGPPGGQKGYQSYARVKSAPYVWYINGYMAPEIWLQRGVQYNFLINGGDNPSEEGEFNPLYISDDPYGGFDKLPEEDKKLITVYAGIDQNYKPLVRGNLKSAGRLCLWNYRNPAEDADAHATFRSFKQTLELVCDNGKSGYLTWTPDSKTPDVLYYQSYVNFNMGWKIMVTDEIPAELPDADEETYQYTEKKIIPPIKNRPSATSVEQLLKPDDNGSFRQQYAPLVVFVTVVLAETVKALL
ncbi:unnamed protein product [Soboliphyme baturini]|uniref:Protein Skeletor n=1 Tax=Soboliphyme baturini TaxID=241478 RepID=A0A183IEQ5_9BILA|nr:unnamed protein product [Soboliphyme baturini]